MDGRCERGEQWTLIESTAEEGKKNSLTGTYLGQPCGGKESDVSRICPKGFSHSVKSCAKGIGERRGEEEFGVWTAAQIAQTNAAYSQRWKKKEIKRRVVRKKAGDSNSFLRTSLKASQG